MEHGFSKAPAAAPAAVMRPAVWHARVHRCITKQGGAAHVFSHGRGRPRAAAMLFMKKYDTTPKKDGFRMPGEFEPHAGSWMLWPKRPDNWRLGGKPAQAAFVETARAIRRHEPLTVGVNEDQYENALARLPEDVRVVQISSEDAWMRDCGPTFVVNEETYEVRGVDWKFNAWGGLTNGRYFPWKLDDQVARKVCDMEYKSRYRLDRVVLEGGAVGVDGEGTVIATEECMLSSGRNPDLSKEETEEILCAYLGADKVIWLSQGLYLDQFCGHVDNICSFAGPGKVLLAWTDDTADPQHDICVRNLEILEEATDAKDRKLEIVKVPLPAPRYLSAEEASGFDVITSARQRVQGERLPGSYVSFYIVNGAVIVPQYGDPMDSTALSILQECFPEREMEPVNAQEILLGGGGIHSITLQQPVVPKRPAPVVEGPAVLTASPDRPREGEENGSAGEGGQKGQDQ